MNSISEPDVLPATVLSRLAARDAARLAKVAERAETNRSQRSPTESTQLFWDVFDRQRARIDGALSALAGGRSETDGPQSSAEQINSDLSSLEQTLAESSYFLPPYEMRKADAATKALRQRLADTQPAATQQRRPFGFSKAVKRTSALQAACSASRSDADDASSAAERHSSGNAASEEHIRQNGAVEAREGRQDCAPDRDRCLRGLVGRQVVLRSDSLGGGDFALAELTDCSVWLLGRLSALRCDRLTRCRVYAGPVRGATFIQGAQDCIFMLASHQVRIHAAHGCDFHLRIRSNPIIEDCTRLGFGPCPTSMPVCLEELTAAGLADETGLWSHVHDFLWLRSTPSPNWHVISDDARLVDAEALAQGWRDAGAFSITQDVFISRG